MEFAYNKLQGRIVEKYGTRREFAKAMHISERKLSCFMQRKAFFDQREIMKACRLLDINLDDISAYFFTPNSQLFEHAV